MHTTSPGKTYPVGATVTPRGVNFCVYSRNATGIDLVLFDQPDSATPSEVFSLDPQANRTYYYWNIFVEGIGAGQLYGYRAYGPNQPDRGMYFDPAKLLIDPYAQCLMDNGNYSRLAALRPGDNTAFAFKSVVVDPSTYNWEGDTPLNIHLSDANIYEMHVRGFTRNPNSGVAAAKRGTYAGMIEKIPYLVKLGIKVVELMPIQQFDAQDAPNGMPNYWGYQSLAFFAPHRAYSSRRDRLGPVDEFRDLVKTLHRTGIEVMLDVVFNHTAEGGVGGPIISMRGLDNPTYYILDPNNPAAYIDFTGTGNTVDTNETIVRRLIMDCLRHWVQDMHVDGFRFDEATILSRGEDGARMTNPPLLWDIETDPVLAGTKIIAEAWDAGGLYEVNTFVGDRWAVWNGQYRDTVRRFVKGDTGMVSGLADSLVGSASFFQHPNGDPNRSINFITAHDGFTLDDLVTYNQKNNLPNGENNNDGANNNYSWNCGFEGPGADPGTEALRLKQIKNFLSILFVSQGQPMMVMGDEVRRTQLGDNNAYDQDNEIGWFDWSTVPQQTDLLHFISCFNQFRQGSVIFRDRHFWGEADSAAVTWHGVNLYQPDWGPDSHSLGLELTHPNSPEHYHILFNAYWQPLSFSLPPLPAGQAWARMVDTSLGSPNDFCSPPQPLKPAPAQYLAQPRSVVILAAF
jgi:glycogen operon protein